MKNDPQKMQLQNVINIDSSMRSINGLDIRKALAVGFGLGIGGKSLQASTQKSSGRPRTQIKSRDVVRTTLINQVAPQSAGYKKSYVKTKRAIVAQKLSASKRERQAERLVESPSFSMMDASSAIVNQSYRDRHEVLSAGASKRITDDDPRNITRTLHFFSHENKNTSFNSYVTSPQNDKDSHRLAYIDDRSYVPKKKDHLKKQYLQQSAR